MQEWSNDEWLWALRAGGAAQRQALEALRARILRALQRYLAKHRSAWGADPERARQLAEDLAQEALITILEKLGSFRGQSRFTTWAYAVAIHRALGELRRKHWQEHSWEALAGGAQLPAWPIEVQPSRDPERLALQSELWDTLRRIIEQDLTARQRMVLVGHLFQGVPLDAMADRLGTDRDNVYKILHDARKKLKGRLLEQGLTYADVLKAFEGT